MGKDTGRNRPERPSRNSPGTGSADRKTSRGTSLQYTDAHRETTETGLRILVHMIARAQ